MTTTSQAWTEEMVELAGTSVQLVKGGSGQPLLILHDEMGHQGWMNFHEALGQNNELLIPSPPGFGDSPYLEWIMTMRDMAGWYLEALDDMGVGQINIMGFSFGGWLAAEMATMDPGHFKKLILVDSMGIKPPTGEIFDMFLVVAKEFITEGILDPANTPEFEKICPEDPTPEQAEYWEVAREQTCRLSWRPYMHSRSLPSLLSRLKNLPTQIIWGREDPIVPLSASQVFNDSIPGSQLAIIDNAGHRPEIEQTGEFVRIVQEFLSS